MPVLSSLAEVIEELVPDGLGQRVKPLLPKPRPRRQRYPGRRPVGDRARLAGVVFVLKTSIGWNHKTAASPQMTGHDPDDWS